MIAPAPHGDAQIGWLNGGWGNSVCGFTLVAGKLADANPTTVRNPTGVLVNGHPRVCVVRVRRTGVQALLDGRIVSSWRTDYSDMSTEPVLKLPQKETLGLHLHLDDAEFQVVDLLEINDQGKALR